MSRALDLDQCARALDSCVCFNIRRASRAVTNLFDERLAPSGLRSTQMPILVTICTGGPQSVSTLARSLHMDRSTLSRNLRPLLDAGYLELQPGADRRQKLATVTPSGRAALSHALRLWEGAQRFLVEHIGDSRWDALRAVLDDAVAATAIDAAPRSVAATAAVAAASAS